MKKAVKIVFSVLFVFLIFASPCNALNINPNDYIQLKATKPAGVPLHREAKSSMFARLPDKTIVKVLQTTHTNWLKAGSEDLTGWIVKKYVDKAVQVSPGSGPTFPEGAQESRIWQSDDLCASAINAGARLPRNPDRGAEPIPAISCSKRLRLARIESFSNLALKTTL